MPLSFGSEGFPGGSAVKNPPARVGEWVQSVVREDPLEKEMATCPNILAWRSLWTKESGGLQSVGSQASDPSERVNRQQPSLGTVVTQR